MTDVATLTDYGVLTEPATLTIERLLPGPIDRVWAYLTESELRRKWLAAGEMNLTVGSAFEFHWRNDELTTPPGSRPSGHSSEHRLECRITELDPPRRLSITWAAAAECRSPWTEKAMRCSSPLPIAACRIARRS
jgi:uncharacterized protein YndB with AHSA1/START domain